MHKMQQLMLIVCLIQQQLGCYGSWARGTASAAEAAAAAAAAATQRPLVVVSSSEATLLTLNSRPMAASTANHGADESNEILPNISAVKTRAKAQQTQDESSETTATSSMETETEKLRYKIIAVNSNCTRDLFEMRLDLNRDFHGLLYAKDFPLDCRARGTAHNNITLRLPTSGCGVRAEPRPDGNIELLVRVMLQVEQKLRQSTDILRTVRCKLPPNAMGMAVGTTRAESKSHKQSNRNSRMRALNTSAATSAADSDSLTQATTTFEKREQEDELTKTPHQNIKTTPRVRIWLELGGADGTGAVEVGQLVTLTVRAIVPGTIGVRVVDCAALDGLEASQQLLDERGCPIDEQVMPALHTRHRPAEEGWSKHSEDDLVEKIFTATFPAFKFPDRERLHVSCGVQLCKGRCPNINCRTAEQLILAADKHLARIEVFNSLAVTAPQIEVDRLRYDRRFNMSAEEYPPYVRALPAEGTLCLSVSKLAISFCILGLIFLIAIIVAITSLIRSRRRAAEVRSLTATSSSRLQRADVCTSMFSSSSESAQSARFGSKLFLPYYPNTLPYGRVY